ncbi:NAD(P)H-binding protein [Desulfovibrio sp. OttesenSCG-928-O18]|nr:NAD(P)H-binding protein [Desulfovibrio sp. OttesenSCG-928-O18]
MAVHAITGAFGFSGKYLARRLLDAGETVVTLTNSPDRPNPFAGRVKAFPFRFDDPAAMAESLAGVDVLYNTYWVRFNHEKFSHAGAVQNTEALFEAAKLAGVKRVVHVSITCAEEASPLEYFSGKGYLERVLKESGLSYAIVRPAVLFGPEDILINNIAWTLRHFPVFAVFGDGRYHIQPIFVDDLAALMAEQGGKTENVTINAIGEEDYTYTDLVKMMREELGVWRPIIGVPPLLGYWASVIIGKFVGDVFVTREEIEGLMADTLHAPGAAPTGKTKLSEWVRANRAVLGKRYHGELPRRKDRGKAY